jgi:multiple antibiotic resistance protein
MMPLLKATFLALTALFPIVNPLGSAPLFLSLTHCCSGDQRKILSRRIALNSIVLIVGSYFIGTHILAFFGISLPVAKADVHRTVDAHDLSQKAFYPLALPLTVGPGSISVAITLGANVSHTDHRILFSVLGAVIGAVLIAASVYLC